MRKRHLYSWRLPWTTAFFTVLLLLLTSSQTVLANDDFFAQHQPQHKIVTATIRRSHGPYKGPVLVRRDLNGTSISDNQPSDTPTEPSPLTQATPATLAPTTSDIKQTSSVAQDESSDTRTTVVSNTLSSTPSSQTTASSAVKTPASTLSDGPVAGAFSPYSPDQQQDVSQGESAQEQVAQSAFESSVSSMENSFMNQAFGTGSIALTAQTIQPPQLDAIPTINAFESQTLPTEQQSPEVPQASAKSVQSDDSSSLLQSSTDSSESAAVSSSSMQSSSGLVDSSNAASNTASRSSNAATASQASTSSTGFIANGLFADSSIAQDVTSDTLQTQATVIPTQTQSFAQAVDATSAATSADASTTSQVLSQGIPTVTSSLPRVYNPIAPVLFQSPTATVTQATLAPEAVATSEDFAASQEASQTNSFASQQNDVEATSSLSPYFFTPPPVNIGRPPTTTATAQYYPPPSIGQSQYNGPILGDDSSSIPVFESSPDGSSTSLPNFIASVSSNSPYSASTPSFAADHATQAIPEIESSAPAPEQTVTTEIAQPTGLTLTSGLSLTSGSTLTSATLAPAPQSTGTRNPLVAAPEVTSMEATTGSEYTIASPTPTMRAPLSTFSTVYQAVAPTNTVASVTSLYSGYLPNVLVTQPTSTAGDDVDQVQPSLASSAPGDISQVTPVPATLPAETPGIITPYGAQVMPAGSQPLGGIFFLMPLNYLYLVQDPTAADQIFQFFPNCLASAIGVSDASNDFFVQSITPYSIGGDVISVLNMNVDPSVATSAREAILDPASSFYANPSSPMCGQIAEQINTGLTSQFGIGSTQSSAQTSSSAGSEATNQNAGNTGVNTGGSSKSGSLDGPPAGDSTSSVAKPLGITAAGVAAVGAYAAAMVFGMRRYRRKRALDSGDQSTLPTSSSRRSPHFAPYFDHRRSSTLDQTASTVSSWNFTATERSGSSLSEQARSGRDMSEVTGSEGSSPFSFLSRMHAPRRGGSKPNTLSGQDISGPLTSNNSLGWN